MIRSAEERATWIEDSDSFTLREPDGGILRGAKMFYYGEKNGTAEHL